MNEPGRTLLDLAPRILRLETNALAALDAPLTPRQYEILQCVRRGVATPTAISRTAHISLAAISESVDALCRRGLAARTNDMADRRVSRLQLTEAGSVALDASEQVLGRLAIQLSQGVEDGVLESLAQCLAVVRGRVDEVADPRRRPSHGPPGDGAVSHVVAGDRRPPVA
jgi:DNA-binding MarR family transcriptional regulator